MMRFALYFWLWICAAMAGTVLELLAIALDSIGAVFQWAGEWLEYASDRLADWVIVTQDRHGP